MEDETQIDSRPGPDFVPNLKNETRVRRLPPPESPHVAIRRCPARPPEEFPLLPERHPPTPWIARAPRASTKRREAGSGELDSLEPMIQPQFQGRLSRIDQRGEDSSSATEKEFANPSFPLRGFAAPCGPPERKTRSYGHRSRKASSPEIRIPSAFCPAGENTLCRTLRAPDGRFPGNARGMSREVSGRWRTGLLEAEPPARPRAAPGCPRAAIKTGTKSPCTQCSKFSNCEGLGIRAWRSRD